MTAVVRPDTARGWDVRPLAGRIGIEVRGVDLAAGLSAEQGEQLQWLLAEHGVVVFGDQHIDRDGHVALAEALGTPKPPPDYLPSLADEGYPQMTVISTDNGFAYTSDQWHADVTWMTNPPRYSILHMVRPADAGGDTMWASQFEAYDRLSEPMKRFLEPLTCEHHMPSTGAVTAHPVVIRHPLTGRRALFVNGVFSKRIVELGPAESDAVLRFLYAHSTQPELVCRWHWTLGDVAVWDNHFVQHYAISDYTGPRAIERIEIVGEPPVPAV